MEKAGKDIFLPLCTTLLEGGGVPVEELSFLRGLISWNEELLIGGVVTNRSGEDSMAACLLMSLKL